MSRARNTALGLLAFLAPFMVLEFVLAALDFQYHPPLLVPLWGDHLDRNMLWGRGNFQPHPYWFWEPRPGALVDPATGERINRRGFRGPDPRPTPDRPRLAALGDSSTYGLGVADADTFARRLEKLAGVEVLNFGAPGYTVFQGLQLYQGRVRRYQPDGSIVAFGALNEISPRDPPARERFEITRRTSPWAVSLSNALLRFRSYQLLRWMFGWVRGEGALAEEMQRRYRENFERRDAGEGYVRNVDLPTFRASLAELVETIREDGGFALLVSPPRTRGLERQHPELLDYTEAIFEVGRRSGSPVCDVRSEFRERSGERLLRDRVHPSPSGHRVYAGALLDCLRRHRLLTHDAGPPQGDSG